MKFIGSKRRFCFCSSSRNTRAACPGLDPGAFAFAILQTQSRTDFRDQLTCFQGIEQKLLGYSPHPAARRSAIGFTDVGYGILPAQPGFRRNDEAVGCSDLP
ncbi:MAG TPA: hypothetical protein VFI81_02720 [Rhodanobacteraceae bacterium]|nr:hypothetical protein [Rhodanobacteraceae bacterium]